MKKIELKTQKDDWDTFAYCVWCVLTLGGVYMIRILITMSIRKAFELKKEVEEEKCILDDDE